MLKPYTRPGSIRLLFEIIIDYSDHAVPVPRTPLRFVNLKDITPFYLRGDVLYIRLQREGSTYAARDWGGC